MKEGTWGSEHSVENTPDIENVRVRVLSDLFSSLGSDGGFSREEATLITAYNWRNHLRNEDIESLDSSDDIRNTVDTLGRFVTLLESNGGFSREEAVAIAAQSLANRGNQ